MHVAHDFDARPKRYRGRRATRGRRRRTRRRATIDDGPADVLFAGGEDVVHLRSPPGDGPDEGHTYVRRNAHTIPNYAERHRYGERVSTAFAESTVNVVVGKRFVKRQQMRWSKRGAHLMLQTRTRVLDETLRAKFQSWSPGLFHVRNADRVEHALAA